MSLLVFVLLVILILAVALWAVWYLPLPPMSFPLKNFLMAALCIIALVVIISRAGVLAL